jgi:hypothetical protein
MLAADAAAALTPLHRILCRGEALAARIFTTAPEISLRQCFALFTSEREGLTPQRFANSFVIFTGIPLSFTAARLSADARMVATYKSKHLDPPKRGGLRGWHRPYFGGL